MSADARRRENLHETNTTMIHCVDIKASYFRGYRMGKRFNTTSSVYPLAKIHWGHCKLQQISENQKIRCRNKVTFPPLLQLQKQEMCTKKAPYTGAGALSVRHLSLGRYYHQDLCQKPTPKWKCIRRACLWRISSLCDNNKGIVSFVQNTKKWICHPSLSEVVWIWCLNSSAEEARESRNICHKPFVSTKMCQTPCSFQRNSVLGRAAKIEI